MRTRVGQAMSSAASWMRPTQLRISSTSALLHAFHLADRSLADESRSVSGASWDAKEEECPVSPRATDDHEDDAERLLPSQSSKHTSKLAVERSLTSRRRSTPCATTALVAGSFSR